MTRQNKNNTYWYYVGGLFVAYLILDILDSFAPIRNSTYLFVGFAVVIVLILNQVILRLEKLSVDRVTELEEKVKEYKESYKSLEEKYDKINEELYNWREFGTDFFARTGLKKAVEQLNFDDWPIKPKLVCYRKDCHTMRSLGAYCAKHRRKKK